MVVKELLVIAIIVLIAAFSFPHFGIFLSILGVVALVASPYAILVVLIVPSFRSRFLSA
jgi:hypothetical protein